MSKGNEIIINADPRGKFLEGLISGALKPGCLVEVKAATAEVAGRWTWQAAAPGTDGKCHLIAVLLEDSFQGKLMTDAYVDATRCRVYVPVAGEEVNLLLGEVAGTGNTYAIGDRLIVDAEDGLLVPETGSPQETVAICLEVVTQQAGSNLTRCMIIK